MTFEEVCEKGPVVIENIKFLISAATYRNWNLRLQHQDLESSIGN